MKKIIHSIALVLICSLNSFLHADNAPVSIDCNHYQMSVQSIFKHRLKISIKRGYKNLMDLTFFLPNQKQNIGGRFTKNNLQNTQIDCYYDVETYNLDKIDNNNNLNTSLADLEKRYNAALEESLKEFGVKVGAKMASKIKTYNDDNMFVSFVKWILRNSGRAVVFTFALKEEFKALENGKYSNLSNFIKALKDKGVEESKVNLIYQIINGEKAFGDEETKKYAINAALTYLQESEDIQKRYEEGIRYYHQYHDKIEAEIQELKDNRYHTQANIYNIARKPIDLRTETPNFIVAIDPITKGNNLNDYWTASPDKVFVYDGNEELEWSDGLWNKSLGGSFSFVVAPEMTMDRNTYSKLYLTVGYHQFGYSLDTTFRLSRNFFATTPINARGFSITEPLQFQQQNISAGLTWRFFMNKSFIFDLNGGYIKQSGKLNLYQSKLSEGYTWAQQQIKIVNDTYIPYGGLKIGYGRNGFHNGYHFTIGADFYKPNQTNTTTSKISELTGDKVIGFSSNKLHYKLNIGLSLAF